MFEVRASALRPVSAARPAAERAGSFFLFRFEQEMFCHVDGIEKGNQKTADKGRAIIRDRFSGPEAQRMMSQITLVFGLGPALAPILGGALLNLLGWRSIFWAMLAWTLGMLVLCVRMLPETLPVAVLP